MKQILFITALIIPLMYSCNSHADRIENKLLDCIKIGFADEGEQFKELMIDYESNLIRAGIISDNTGKSYANTIQQIANGIKPKNAPYYSFGNMFSGIEKKQASVYTNCVEQIIVDSTKYDHKKLTRLTKQIEEVTNSAEYLKIEVLASKTSEVLNEKDYNLDYYKIRAFLLFDMLRNSP